jgi:two-component system OmpR family sensor kinase
MVAEEFASAAGGRRSVAVTCDAPLAVPVDVDAFAIVMRNLIENALVHGSITEPVTVRILPGSIEVTNGGPVIEPERLQGLIQPFRRGDTAARGTGLGLSIADALARQMGARLELKSPAAERPDGFQASLVFSSPADRQPQYAYSMNTGSIEPPQRVW